MSAEKTGDAKILVGGIINCDRNFQLAQFIRSVKGLSHKNKKIVCIDNGSIKELQRFYRHIEGIQFEKVESKSNEREAIVAAREYFRKKAIDEDYDWLLIVDQSIVLPDNFVERAIATGRKIISGLYFETASTNNANSKIITYLPNLFSFSGNDGKNVTVSRLSINDVLPSKTFEVDMAELKVIMLHKSILEKIGFVYQDNPLHGDIHFAMQCRKIQQKIAVDSGIVCRNNRAIVMDAFS